MAECFLNDRVTLHCGDCREVLATLPENWLDACVTDPPYHLVSIVKRFANEKPWDVEANFAERKIDGQGVGPFARAARGFMGKVWDGGDVAFRPETWAAVYRVLKPGAHLVAMGGTRTYHRLACAIEDAGFEIRDTVSWLYGSGFPKSHSIGNGWGTALKPACELIVLARKPLSESTVAGNVLRWGTGAINISACRVRTADDSNGGNGRSHTSDQRTSIQNIEHQQMFAQQHAERDCLLSNAIERARGDQLPLNSIGDCLTCPHCGDELPRSDVAGGQGLFQQLGDEDIARAFPSCPRRAHILAGLSMPSGNNTAPDIERQGRWPANVIHDGSAEVLAAFPDVHGAGAARNGSSEPRESNHENITSWSKQSSTGDMFRIGDSGSAARFFYTSKADSDDRLGSKHPTVKPLDLMQYLVRLVTPPRGICLDPFAGTGTTGEAAWREGMRAVLIEAEPEYQADIRRRMALALAGPDERSRESIRARNLPRDDGPLFASRETWTDMWAKPFDFSQEPRE